MNVDALRSALLRSVTEETAAEDELARARRGERLAEAHRRANALVAEARRDGEDEVAVDVAQRLVRARREARSAVLAAQREVYDEFVRRTLDAVIALRHGEEHARLVERLSAVAREQLGSDAEIEVDEAVGGVVGRRDGRRVDYTLPALVDRAIGDLGARLQELWR